MTVEETPIMFATEVGAKEIDEDKSELIVSNQVQFKLHVSDATETKNAADDGRKGGNVNNSTAGKDNSNDNEDAKDGLTRVESASKSVRFIEEGGKQKVEREQSDLSRSSKEMKQIMNENIVKRQNSETVMEKLEDSKVDSNNKKNQRVSCKEEKIEDIYKKDEDDDEGDDNGNNSRKDNQSGKGRNSENRQASRGSGESNSENRKDGSEQKGNVPKDGLETLDKETVADDGKNGAKRKTQKSLERRGSATGSRPSSSRAGSKKGDTKGKKSDTGKHTSAEKSGRYSGRLSSSAKGGCSKFDKSEASRQHINTLEASSVLHGSSVVTTVGPETPKRAKTNSARSERRTSKSASKTDTNGNAEFKFFSEKARPCFEANDDFEDLYNRSEKTKVKFLLEGEEPEVETIFIEDEGEVNIKDNKLINFDVLDTELAMLRADISNALTDVTTANEGIEQAIEAENDDATKTNAKDETDTDRTNETDRGSETMETVRGDYSSILEKYRYRCMERSEVCGEISTCLATPRETNSFISSRTENSRNPTNRKVDNGDIQKDVHTKTVLSDSGRGSVENLSEVSRSASVPVTPVPRLDLGDCTSDLGLDSSRSDKTVTKETNGKEEQPNGQTEQETYTGEKTLLEMMCDQLTPLAKVRVLLFASILKSFSCVVAL